MPCLTTAAHLSHSDRDAGPHRSTNVPCLTTAARPLAGLPFAGLPERSTNVPCLTTAAHRGPAWRELGWVLPRSTNVPCLTTAAQAAIANIAHPVRVHRPLNECAVSDDIGTANDCFSNFAWCDRSTNVPCLTTAALPHLSHAASSSNAARSTNVPCLTTAARVHFGFFPRFEFAARSTNVPCLTTAARRLRLNHSRSRGRAQRMCRV